MIAFSRIDYWKIDQGCIFKVWPRDFRAFDRFLANLLLKSGLCLMVVNKKKFEHSFIYRNKWRKHFSRFSEKIKKTSWADNRSGLRSRRGLHSPAEEAAFLASFAVTFGLEGIFLIFLNSEFFSRFCSLKIWFSGVSHPRAPEKKSSQNRYRQLYRQLLYS